MNFSPFQISPSNQLTLHLRSKRRKHLQTLDKCFFFLFEGNLPLLKAWQQPIQFSQFDFSDLCQITPQFLSKSTTYRWTRLGPIISKRPKIENDVQHLFFFGVMIIKPKIYLENEIKLSFQGNFRFFYILRLLSKVSFRNICDLSKGGSYLGRYCWSI